MIQIGNKENSGFYPAVRLNCSVHEVVVYFTGIDVTLGCYSVVSCLKGLLCPGISAGNWNAPNPSATLYLAHSEGLVECSSPQHCAALNSGISIW